MIEEEQEKGKALFQNRPKKENLKIFWFEEDDLLRLLGKVVQIIYGSKEILRNFHFILINFFLWFLKIAIASFSIVKAKFKRWEPLAKSKNQLFRNLSYFLADHPSPFKKDSFFWITKNRNCESDFMATFRSKWLFNFEFDQKSGFPWHNTKYCIHKFGPISQKTSIKFQKNICLLVSANTAEAFFYFKIDLDYYTNFPL